MSIAQVCITRVSRNPRADEAVLKKIEQVMCNTDFNHEYPDSYAIFQPYRISDHSPSVLKIYKKAEDKPKPFKFFNFLVYKTEFIHVVADMWGTDIESFSMFQVVKRLRLLKKPLWKLVHAQGNLHDRVVKIRLELEEVQKALDRDLESTLLHEEEEAYLMAFTQATLEEEQFLVQKAKIDWLREGDSNMAYFH
ncbi:RNA-directed DNA polymerase, eukaryota, Reverse transcriptase zinc-binding domain protein [Artemisia annua]|uniref:RNA-directed DNA polymerase, eukaryota, Reverse transcriptase zinc-binding domain protein n=1 Tax=Artemisia annua TaxID=35608 RepID=A0A2U1KML1_ARTAN|nr:RNA-directed DNA polymerase, eukaryota, Reverse transcriptase zinc-binding domain protein [Artemisia annua]